jgi:lambda family phage portal protein
LNVGESISVVDPKRGGETFNSFMEGVLRIIGISLGLPYELLVKDFSKTNYSSARAALLEGRRHFSNWRAWFGRKFCQPFWELVLEEAMLRGLLDVRPQDFYARRAEYCRAAWIGGGWGWVDPVKEVESSKLAIDWGLSTYAEETASQGRDWEEVLEQRSREEARIKELGLVIPEARAKGVAQTETAPPLGEPGGGK